MKLFCQICMFSYVGDGLCQYVECANVFSACPRISCLILVQLLHLKYITNSYLITIWGMGWKLFVKIIIK